MAEPYIIDLSGQWKISEGTNTSWIATNVDDQGWNEIKLPGMYYAKGLKCEIYIFNCIQISESLIRIGGQAIFRDDSIHYV